MPKQGKQCRRRFVTPNFRIIAVTAMVLLLGSATTLLAQHSGGRGGGRGGARGAGGNSSGPAADPTEIKDFNRLMAVQATEIQTQQFQAAAKSTEAARKQAHDLMQQADTNASADFTSQTTALKDTVDGARSWNDYFLKSFSTVQVSGLKEFTKKLTKAESDLVKERSALDHDLPGAGLDGKRAAAAADKLEKALTKFQSEQLSLADEMGIQRPAP